MNERSVEDRLQQFPYEPSEIQWHAVFDDSPIGIVFCSKDGTFLKCNNAFCNIVEYTENELVHKSYTEITHPDDLPFDSGMMKKCQTKEIPGYEMYKRYLTKTGKIVWVRLTAWALHDADGNVINFCAHIQRMINGDKVKLEKQENGLVYRPQISIREFIADNIKATIFVCVFLITTFTTIGVAFWGSTSEITRLRKQQQEQQQLMFKLYDIISSEGLKPNE